MILLLSLSRLHHYHLLADISTFLSNTPLVSLLRIYPDPFSLSFLADQLREGLEVLWFILQAWSSLPILLRYSRSQDTNSSPPSGLLIQLLKDKMRKWSHLLHFNFSISTAQRPRTTTLTILKHFWNLQLPNNFLPQNCFPGALLMICLAWSILI